MPYFHIKPLGFVVIDRNPYPFFGIRFLRWHVSFKPTTRETFSQRNGYRKCFRLLGVTATFQKVTELPSPTTQTEE